MKIYKTIFVVFLAMAFVGCGGQLLPAAEPDAPTVVLKKFVEASKKKDVETMKQTLSSGTLKMLDETAKKQNTTLDELLKKEDGNALKEMPETRNEKIEGETATVEVKNAATADWDKIPFVKEDGKWKIALDKFMQDLMKKMTDEMKIPDSSVPKTNGGANKESKDSPPAAAANNKKP